MKKNKHKNSTVAIAALMGMTTAINPAFPTVHAQSMNDQNPTENQEISQTPEAENSQIQENTYSKDAQPVEEETKEHSVASTLEAPVPTNVQNTTSGVTIDEINFPDPVFRQWVMDNADTEDANGKKDGILTPEEIKNVVEIKIDGFNVSEFTKLENLAGIDHFTSLRRLIVIKTNLQFIDLSNNKNLYKIEVSYSKLKSLDITALTNLITLECNYNDDLVNLSLNKDAKLKTLNCSYTSLSNLDISPYASTLTSLNIAFTNIIISDFSPYKELQKLDISGLNYSSLDLSKNLNLERLECALNPNLKTLDISKNYNLGYLSISKTALTEYDGTANPNLYTLIANGTKLKNINIKNNPKLNWLLLQECGISEIDISNNELLTSLNLSFNSIKNIDISKNTLLRSLEISNNALSTLDISKNPELSYLIVSNNKLVSLDASKNSKLKNLSCSGNMFLTLNLPAGVDVTGAVNQINSEKISIDLPADNTYDLKNLYPNISAKELNVISSSIENATIEGTLLHVVKPGEDVIFKFPCDLIGKYTLKVRIKTNSFSNKLIWTSDLNIENWIYGQDAKKPTITSNTGTITYSYSEDGVNFTTPEKVLTHAGTFYVKAEATDPTYGTISTTKEFQILKAPITENEIPAFPSNLTSVSGNTLSTISLGNGWTWKEPTQKVSVYNTGYEAYLTVDDTNYDYSKIEGYDDTTHRVYRTLPVQVSKITNSWTTPLALQDWMVNETPIYPTAKAKYGTVSFLYSDSKNGTYTDTLPATVGTWYVKAVVAGTTDYEGLESEVASFTIKEAPKEITKETKPEVKKETSPIVETSATIHTNPAKLLLVFLGACLAFFKKKTQQE